ncbi:MAG TPA: MurR/RpiR family transcriptional regulator [Chloroflexota bacterium]
MNHPVHLPGAQDIPVIEDVGGQPGIELTLGLTDFLHRLNAAEASFSANDAAIASFVRRNPLAAALSTADQLGHRLDVSKAAIVRFAARLGYQGFTELREDLRQRVIHEQGESPASLRDDGLDDVRIFLSTKLTSDLASLSSFVESVDQHELQRCAELLVQPTATVFVAGQRRGFAAATLAQRLFSWIRPGVRLWRMEEPGLALALDEVSAGDVVLAFAFRRFPRVTGVLLEYAREVGASTILVTESLTCPCADLADSILLCPSAGSSAFDSSLPAVFCVETLAGLMIRLVGADVDDRIRRLLDSRHASHLEDADMNGESELLLRTRSLARRRRRAKR